MATSSTDQTERKAGEPDIITREHLRELGAVEGPCVSVTMPTHRAGPDTLQGSIRLGNLIVEAEDGLDTAGVDKRTRGDILAPMRALVDDNPFWQDQAGGLALFAAPGYFSFFRVAMDLAESATVSRNFRFRAILPAVDGDRTSLLLAITTNSVRLFQANRYALTELELGPIPGSMDEALKFEDPEGQLQSHRHGDASATGFHGHGEGKEVRKEELERFMRAVDRGLHERVGNGDKPLILACVSYYEPIFRSVSAYPKIADRIVEGSPERLKPHELHAQALPILEALEGADTGKVIDRYHATAGTGRTLSEIDQIVEAGSQGRIETLLLSTDAPEHWMADGEENGSTPPNGKKDQPGYDQVDAAVIATIAHGGDVLMIDGALNNGEKVAAILRF